MQLTTLNSSFDKALAPPLAESLATQVNLRPTRSGTKSRQAIRGEAMRQADKSISEVLPTAGICGWRSHRLASPAVPYVLARAAVLPSVVFLLIFSADTTTVTLRGCASSVAWLSKAVPFVAKSRANLHGSGELCYGPCHHPAVYEITASVARSNRGLLALARRIRRFSCLTKLHRVHDGSRRSSSSGSAT